MSSVPTPTLNAHLYSTEYILNGRFRFYTMLHLYLNWVHYSAKLLKQSTIAWILRFPMRCLPIRVRANHSTATALIELVDYLKINRDSNFSLGTTLLLWRQRGLSDPEKSFCLFLTPRNKSQYSPLCPSLQGSAPTWYNQRSITYSCVMLMTQLYFSTYKHSKLC